MRLFIAINFNNDTRARLIALQDELRLRSKRGRFSTPDNLHLTLVFLGECDAKQAANVKVVLDALKFDAFEIAVERVGRFRREGSDIWWAGLRESKSLLDAQRDLAGNLRAAGFEVERRKFSPHITLARDVATDASPKVIVPFSESVTSIDLMKSERIAGKLTYTVIYRHRNSELLHRFAPRNDNV